MRRRGVFVVVAAVASLLASAPGAPAGATGSVLTVGSADGTAVAVGDTLTLSGPVSFCSGTSGTSCVKCTMTVTVTINSNPPPPGTATFTVTAVSFSNCTVNIAFVTGVRSISVGLPLHGSVGPTSVTISGPVNVTIVLIPTFGSDTTCAYQASSLSGTTSNVDNSVSFTNQQFTKSSGPGTCFSMGFFSTKLSPVRDVTQPGAPLVFVN